MKNPILSLLLLALTPSAGLRAEPLRITTADGRGADAHVTGADVEAEDGAADANFGASPELTFKGSPNINYHSAVYLRFDLSPLKGKTVTSARLELTAMDGDFFALDRLMLDHSSDSHHHSSFADIRIASTFRDLVDGENVLVAADFEPAGPGKNTLDGLESGAGFAGPWSAEKPSARVAADGPRRRGWTSRGNRVDLKGRATRPFEREIRPDTGTRWLGGFLASSNSARTATVGFGGLSVSHSAGGPLRVNGVPARTPAEGDMHFFLVRVDFDPLGNRVWMWQNPDLADGEPDAASAEVAFTAVTQQKSVAASVYGLKPGVEADAEPVRLGADWPEGELTWNNAPGGFVDRLDDRTGSGEAYHIYSLDLNAGREGLTASVSSPKLVWFLNHLKPEPATLILQGRDDRNLPFASKEHSSLPPPTLIVEAE